MNIDTGIWYPFKSIEIGIYLMHQVDYWMYSRLPLVQPPLVQQLDGLNEMEPPPWQVSLSLICWEFAFFPSQTQRYLSSVGRRYINYWEVLFDIQCLYLNNTKSIIHCKQYGMEKVYNKGIICSLHFFLVVKTILIVHFMCREVFINSHFKILPAFCQLNVMR